MTQDRDRVRTHPLSERQNGSTGTSSSVRATIWKVVHENVHGRSAECGFGENRVVPRLFSDRCLCADHARPVYRPFSSPGPGGLLNADPGADTGAGSCTGVLGKGLGVGVKRVDKLAGCARPLPRPGRPTRLPRWGTSSALLVAEKEQRGEVFVDLEPPPFGRRGYADREGVAAVGIRPIDRCLQGLGIHRFETAAVDRRSLHRDCRFSGRENSMTRRLSTRHLLSGIEGSNPRFDFGPGYIEAVTQSHALPHE